MIKFAFRLLVVLVIAVLGYNYFYGTTEEKESTQKIVNELKEVGVAVKDLLRSEKEKMDEGKYDNALDKIGDLFQKVKNGVEKIDPEKLNKLNELERKRKDLSNELHSEDQGELDGENKDQMNNEIKKLLRDTEKLLREINEENK